MKKKIVALLKKLERKNKIKILFAVESGSREWGFASKDSDYDVRAVHFSPTERYLGLEKVPEQFELIEKKHRHSKLGHQKICFSFFEIKSYFSKKIKSYESV